MSAPPDGYPTFMDDPDPTDPTEQAVESRAAELTPEELAAGSADPHEQARAILEESLERTEEPGSTPDSFLERRRSEDTL